MRIQIRKLHIWLWSGSWVLVERLDCDCCAWNFYIGPFGVEWDLP